MKIFKIISVIVIACMISFSISATAYAADPKNMTNAQLADILVKVLDQKMPDGSDKLSDEEYYKVQANILAGQDITNFLDSDPDALVTRGELADILYNVLVGPFDVDPQVKLDFVVYLGYVNIGNLEDILGYNEIIMALNNPAISGIVFGAYSVPGEDNVGDIPQKDGTPPEQMAPQAENAASPV
ncbi:MAG: hypothetical protein HQ594_07690 [Candidatus Omnitrophica bacterium]|nr:hypothetical protein [Candidatus Omnitrophota bacterium]